MKKNEIKIGSKYRMKVSGTVQTVRVDSIGVGTPWHGSKEVTTWYCTNLATGRKCSARSAMKFRGEVKEPGLRPDQVKRIEKELDLIPIYTGPNLA